ncbi:MAG: alginate lyase family protein [Mesotoga sp.]
MRAREIFAKLADKVFRKTGVYFLVFARSKDNQNIEMIPLDLEKFKAKLAMDLKKGVTQCGLALSKEHVPFWKVAWKGFDPKDFWEIARGWQWLPAVLANKNETERSKVIEKISSWLDQHPYPSGLEWAVGLDVAIRAMNLALIFSITGNRKLEGHLYYHYLYLKKMLWLSRNAIRNNHYLGELTVLALLATMMNRKDAVKLSKILEKEIERQFYRDGVNVEQSVRYHKFSLEFALLAKLFLGIESPVLEKAGDFVLALKKPDGSWPSIGDDDLGCILRLHSDDLNGDYKAILSVLSVIFDRPDFKRTAEELSAEAELLVKDAASKWASLKDLEPKKSYLFKEGGFFAYRTGWNRDDSYFLVKFGPHKWHAHADLFHIEFSINGQNILVDSGTYRYNNVPEQRIYFRGTSAHNTISINDLDQTKQWTTFRWHRPARVTEWKFDENSKGFEFGAGHNGYRGIGLLHSRRISGSSDLKTLMVSDCIEGKGRGTIKLFWHFSPELSLEKTGENDFSILNQKGLLGALRMNTEETFRAKIFDTPFSERYGSLSTKKTLQIEIQKCSRKEINIDTEFQFK